MHATRVLRAGEEFDKTNSISPAEDEKHIEEEKEIEGKEDENVDDSMKKKILVEEKQRILIKNMMPNNNQPE